MSTGHTWLNLYPGKILGLQDLDEHLAATVRAQADQMRRDVFGLGGALDARATISVTGDELTLTADFEGYTPSGKRLVLDASEPEYGDVPFEDSGAIVYQVAARHIDVPVEAQDGIDGRPHFSYHRERVGVIFAPAAVALDVGGGLLLTMTASLPQGMRWSVSAETRPVIVWFEDAGGDPASKSTLLAIEAGELVENAGAFTVTTQNRFGQAAASLDPARYKVAILGPAVFRNVELPGEYATDYLPLGSITSGVFDNSAAPLVNNFGDTITAFNVQHNNVTGEHTDVTADSIEVGSPANVPVPANGDLAAERVLTNALVAGPVANSATVAPVAVLQANGTSKVELRSGNPATAGGGGELHFPNPSEASDLTCRIATNHAGNVDLALTNLIASNAQGLGLVVDGIIRKSSAKSGIPFSLRVDEPTDEEIIIENINAGRLDLRLQFGDILIDTGGIDLAFGDITVPSGTISGSVFEGPSALWSASPTGVVDAAEFTGPLVTLTPVASEVAYAYSSRVQFQVDYHPIQGGWIALEDPAVVRPGYSTGTTPPYVRPSATAQNLTLRIPLTIPNWYRSSPAAKSDLIRIVQIDIRYRRVNAADTVVFRVWRVRKDGTAAENLVAAAQIIAGVSGAADAVAGTGVINHIVDRGTFTYWLEVTLQADATQSDARIMDVIATFDKLGIE